MHIPQNEYAPFYQTYLNYVGEDIDLVDTLHTNFQEVKELVNGLPFAKKDYKYQPDKWSIAEVLGHLNDTERIMAYRALRISRGDTTPLPGYEENDYIASKIFEGRTLSSLSEEFTTIRHATISLFSTIPASAWSLNGTASGSPVSVRALAGIIIGHARHHIKVIEERYL
jgi:hypothetical protein